MAPNPSHEVQWVTASPLWRRATDNPPQMRRPALLRFTSDNFMELALAEVQSDLNALADRLATGDSPSYQLPAPGDQSKATAAPLGLKLYQPAHGHFHLVAANLVCRLPGLPDHVVDPGHGDQVSFVLRRLRSDGSELAFSADAGGGRWRPAAPPDSFASGEETMGMFPMVYGENGRRRRMLAGFLPTAQQEQWQSARVDAPAAAPAPAPVRPTTDDLEELKGRVVDALVVLITSKEVAARAALEIEASRFVLIDLADFLATLLPTVWAAVKDPTLPAPAGDGGLVTLLRTRRVEGGSGPTFAEAAVIAWNEGPTITASRPDGAPSQSQLVYNLRHADPTLPTAFQAAVKTAAATAGSSEAPLETIDTHGTRFVVRCVYRRTRCAPFKPDVLSPPSEPFTIAPFFDADAPARPIRISLPIDASLAGLRKLRKNVAVVVSKSLRDKMKQAGGMKDDEVVGPGIDCGAFMLSIPIITICALIVLMIFISLLNIIFWWMPLFKICLPKIEVK